MSKRPLCLFFIGLVIAIGLMHWLGLSWIWRSPAGTLPEEWANRDHYIEASGIVYQTEEKTYQDQTNTYIYIRQTILTINSKEYPVRNIKCIVEKDTELRSGSRVIVYGKLSMPELPTNPGEFNQRLWNRAQKIDYNLEECEIRSIEENEGILANVEDIRSSAIDMIHAIFPEVEAGILDAMMFGTKEALSSDIKEEFQAAGISHIMAISGLHISLLGMAVWSGLQWLGIPIWISVGISLTTLFGYMILIGSPTTALRAFFMFAIMACGKLLGRAYDKLSALSGAGILLLLDNPDLLFYCGFQLSFLAVFGISVFGEIIEKIYDRMWEKKNRNVWKTIRSGVSLWIFTLPVVLFHFYQVSVLGIVCNLFVIPLLPFLLGSSFLALISGYWGVRVGSIVGIPAYGILKLYQWLGNLSESTKIGVWTPGQPGAAAICIYYILVLGLVGSFYYLLKKEELIKQFRWRITIAHHVILVILLIVIAIPWKNSSQVTMLDVGQGDGIILQTNGYVALIDGGSSSRGKIGKNVILPFMKHQGISVLHVVIVTHSDQDHLSGVLEVLEEAQKGWLNVERLCMPEWMCNTEEGTELMQMARKSKTEVAYLHQGEQILMGNSKIKILYPRMEDFSQEPNAGSLVFVWESEVGKGLFLGDLPGEQEQQLLEVISDCEYIKIGHHGSNYSTTESLLEQADPEIALISCGENNRYGHPGNDLLERLDGIRIYRTDQHGAITITEKSLATIN